jgi:hypothetical protein
MPAKTKIILSSLKKKAFTIVLLFHVLTVSFLSAQENNQQPTIGLVLSGGGPEDLLISELLKYSKKLA